MPDRAADLVADIDLALVQALQQVVARTKVRQTVLTSIGELLGFKGLIVDFVLRHVKKMIPRYSLHGAVKLSDTLAEGRKHELAAVAAGRAAVQRARAARARLSGFVSGGTR